MKRKVLGDEVRLFPESDEEFRGIVLDLNKDYIPCQIWSKTLIVLTYNDWLNSNLKENYNED